MPRIFTENQATLVYVAKALKTDFASLKDAGDILVKSTPDKQAIYFQHKGVADVSRSDLIKDSKRVEKRTLSLPMLLLQRIWRKSSRMPL